MLGSCELWKEDVQESHFIFLHSENWWGRLRYSSCPLSPGCDGTQLNPQLLQLLPDPTLPTFTSFESWAKCRNYSVVQGFCSSCRSTASTASMGWKKSERYYSRSLLQVLVCPWYLYDCLSFLLLLALLTSGQAPNTEITAFNSQHNQLPQLCMV